MGLVDYCRPAPSKHLGSIPVLFCLSPFDYHWTICIQTMNLF